MTTKHLDSCFRATIVIPAHNEEVLISNCLNSVAIALGELEKPQEVGVIIVDNDSSDNTNKIAKSFNKMIPMLSVIKEKELGIGYARATGARFAFMESFKKNSAHNQDFWIINTDADTIVPKSWLVDWFKLFTKKNSILFTGSSTFGNSFNTKYPVASELFDVVGKNISRIEELFGVINIDGFNSAIERKCYNIAGPFQQPKSIKTLKGQVFNLAGEDWDIGTRARLLSIKPLRSSAIPVVVSARRFEKSPLAFINGDAYEEPFVKIENFNLAPDFDSNNYLENYQKATLRLCVHYVEKPLLINTSLLDNHNICQQLGVNLINDIRRWIKLTPKPDFFYHRDYFILDYLVKFHTMFGARIREKLF